MTLMTTQKICLLTAVFVYAGPLCAQLMLPAVTKHKISFRQQCFCLQVSFGPISWLLVGEIFPLSVRFAHQICCCMCQLHRMKSHAQLIELHVAIFAHAASLVMSWVSLGTGRPLLSVWYHRARVDVCMTCFPDHVFCVVEC